MGKMGLTKTYTSTCVSLDETVKYLANCDSSIELMIEVYERCIANPNMPDDIKHEVIYEVMSLKGYIAFR